jgi:hypothetical protein
LEDRPLLARRPLDNLRWHAVLLHALAHPIFNALQHDLHSDPGQQLTLHYKTVPRRCVWAAQSSALPSCPTGKTIALCPGTISKQHLRLSDAAAGGAAGGRRPGRGGGRWRRGAPHHGAHRRRPHAGARLSGRRGGCTCYNVKETKPLDQPHEATQVRLCSIRDDELPSSAGCVSTEEKWPAGARCVPQLQISQSRQQTSLCTMQSLLVACH